MKELIVNELNRLKEIDYRNGFNDSVLSKVCDVLGNHYERNTPASDFWNAACCGRGEKYITETYGAEVYALYNEVSEMAAGEGCFVMPDWGTRGT